MYVVLIYRDIFAARSGEPRDLILLSLTSVAMYSPVGAPFPNLLYGNKKNLSTQSQVFLAHLKGCSAGGV